MAGPLKRWLAIGGLGRPEQVAVVEQVGDAAGILTRPGVNDAAFVVIQIGRFAAGIDKVVPWKRPRVVQQHAEIFGRYR